MRWVQSSVSLAMIAIVTFVVVGLQYTRRTTTLARSLTTAGWASLAFVSSLIPWSEAFAIQSRLLQTRDRSDVGSSRSRFQPELG